MSRSGSGRSCWKTGCIGCAGLLGIGVVLLALAAGVAAVKAKTEVVGDHVLEPSLTPAGASNLALDLRHAGFLIQPAEPGSGLRVEATFDEKSYLLEEGYEEREWGRTYVVRFRRKGSSFLVGLKELFGGSSPRVSVFLPPDLPLNLDVAVREGAAEAELGGLWLTSAVVEVNRGALELNVGEPMREPMRELTIRGAMGGINTSLLGNASPAKISLSYSMGGAMLDLRGQWRQDAQVDVATSMSGTQVRLPRDVVVRGLDAGKLDPGPRPEVALPTLTFSVNSKMGGTIEFQRR